ncbi:MAG: histidine--tRNA ligase [Waddliaceae bacterium]|nr:histidine--tRNA ligase [Waddliaceae bacterium]
MKYTIPKGTFDIVPQAQNEKERWKDSGLWQKIEELIRNTVSSYGFQEIRTPVFEQSSLFHRSVGEATDIISKEMYEFEDRGGRSICLRPEGTAPVMRAYVERAMHHHSPVSKLFYIGPMFRYERPQAGRFRQHHQFGAEAIGVASAEQDVEIIDLLYTVYSRIGLQNLSVQINSIGDHKSRKLYREALTSYLKPHLNSLSEDSQRRLEQNPLRILDSKNPSDKEILTGAPSILDFLGPESKDRFELVKTRLTQLGIPFTVVPSLVRGLDYYNETVFEIVSGELGAQNSIGGGGRYDGLIKTLGGPDLPAVGFGTGLERILQTALGQNVAFTPTPGPIVFFIPLGVNALTHCVSLLHQLREENLHVEMDYSGRKLGKVMSYADNINSQYVAVVGDQEIANNSIELKHMKSGEKTAFSLEGFSEQIKKLAKG